MSEMKKVTIVAFGQTGGGKSEFLNAYINTPGAFEANSSPDSVTFRTSMKSANIGGMTRCAIDTQGLDDTKGLDAEHVQQMVEFLKEYEGGVNAFALIINIHSPRIDGGTQRLIGLLHAFFNNPSFWNHVCIVFTRCYAMLGEEELQKSLKRTEYKKRLLGVIMDCIGTEDFPEPPLPVFFVDSKKFQTDVETKSELAALHGWAFGLDALPTKNVVQPLSKIEEEIDTREVRRRKQDISANTDGALKTFGKGFIYGATFSLVDLFNSKEKVGVNVYVTIQTRKREKRTCHGKPVTYGDWVIIDEKQHCVFSPEPEFGSFRCDGCGKDISPLRLRYHCVDCEDYDLCESCMKKGDYHPKSHVLVGVVAGEN